MSAIKLKLSPVSGDLQALPSRQALRRSEIQSTTTPVGEPTLKTSTSGARTHTDVHPRAADHIINHLVLRERVDIFFGLPGGAISPLHDALYRRNDVRHITTQHEADAVFAAAGYARATGKVGVALVTSGPGVLNALNALASAHLEGLPVLLLAGEAPRARFGRGAMQEGSSYGLDIVHMARSITKISTELTDSDTALPQLLAALATMKRGRMGAGLITCPVDVSARRVKVAMVGMPSEEPPLLNETALDRAAELLGAAQRPLIYAGNGVRAGDGPAALRAFAERLQAPVITTPHGKGVFPESHPLALGLFGWGEHKSATAYLNAGVDVLFVVGSSLSELSTSGWSPLLRPTTAFIQVDVDASRLSRVYPVDVGIVGHAAPALRSLANRLAPRPAQKFGVERNSNPAVFKIGPERRITPQRTLWELQRTLPKDTWFTCDIGEHALCALHQLQIDDPHAFNIQLSLCSMGSGLGVAVGLAAAFRDHPVGVVTGDGCFAMQLGTVAVAASEKLPLVFTVFNDQRLGMCEIGHELIYGEKPDYQTAPIDVVRTAEGLGAQAIRIEAPGQILALNFAKLLKSGPVVLDVVIDRKVRMPRHSRNDLLKNEGLQNISNWSWEDHHEPHNHRHPRHRRLSA
jgi:acetolactate synthase-1/2/3 large subunit